MKLKTSICLLIFSLISNMNFAQTEDINTTIDKWHKAAAEADFKAYFDLMSSDAVFVGSDASEVWNYTEFKSFSKPYFDKGKAWEFNPVDRNVYTQNNMAWFDEVLNSSHMGLCRGSGVLIQNENGEWKIKHYVLSLAIPNALVDELVQRKAKFEKDFLENLDKN